MGTRYKVKEWKGDSEKHWDYAMFLKEPRPYTDRGNG
jgi:hypothetical protein